MQIKIKADLHTHSMASGHAYSTIDELVRGASKRGLQLVAITDHGPAMPGASHEFHFGNMKIIPDVLYGVNILTGIEANILNDGSLDLSDKRLDRLDFVAAGIHSDAGYENQTKTEHTQAMINAIKNPQIDMITHPANLAFPVDLEKVVKAAAKHNVIMEANASSFYSFRVGRRGDRKMSVQLCRLAREYGVPLSLNSDAHFHTEVGDITFLSEIVQEAEIQEKDIINSSAEKVLDFLDI